MNTIKQDYIEKANALSLSNELNQDQKDLILSIIDKFEDNDPALHNVYQLLIKRVKLGFVFDIAPSVNASEIALFKKDEKLSFNNDNNKPTNTLIIGENYDALKNLIVIERERERESQSETVNYDVIYIDPPYNTESSLSDGNNLSEKDDVGSSKFIYRDKFSRTGWLNMLNERLRMAKQLLKEDGVIFVSIDDSEQAYLKVLMDEIFGEENFIACVPAILNPSGRQVNTEIALTHEYILIYGGVNFVPEELDNEYVINKLPEIYKNRNLETLVDNKGEYWLQYTLENQSKKFNDKNRPNLAYPIFINKDENHNLYHTIEPTEKTIYTLWPKNVNGVQYVWRWSREKINKEKEELVIKMDNDKFKIYPKKRKNTWIFKTIIKGSSFNNKTGNKVLSSILKSDEFSTAKPVELIKLLIKLHPNNNARILDFYAGSGTTGHAVMELNKEDGGNRCYTLVTNNENNIATNVCYERLYRINNGISTNNESNFDWIKKNKPYKSNLNVYDIEYFSTKLFDDNQSNMSIKEQYIKMLQDFNIDTEDKDSNIDILRSLTSLKPISKEDTDAIK
nr:site-specific DNA-methyltransferase [Mycoplasmopsis bovis]